VNTKGLWNAAPYISKPSRNYFIGKAASGRQKSCPALGRQVIRRKKVVNPRGCSYSRDSTGGVDVRILTSPRHKNLRESTEKDGGGTGADSEQSGSPKRKKIVVKVLEEQGGGKERRKKTTEGGREEKIWGSGKRRTVAGKKLNREVFRRRSGGSHQTVPR